MLPVQAHQAAHETKDNVHNYNNYNNESILSTHADSPCDGSIVIGQHACPDEMDRTNPLGLPQGKRDRVAQGHTATLMQRHRRTKCTLLSRLCLLPHQHRAVGPGAVSLPHGSCQVETLHATNEPTGVIWNFSPIAFEKEYDEIMVEGTDAQGQKVQDKIKLRHISKNK